VVVGNRALIDAIREHQGMLGALASPFTAYMLIRGLKTFAIRMRQHNTSGQRIAEFLAAHPKVEQVWYPGLSSHPAHAIAKRQMHGYGGLISFAIKGGLIEARRWSTPARSPTWRRASAAREPDRAAGADELLRQVAGGAHRPRHPRGPDPHERRAGDGADLIADLDQALAKI